jgi:hypothetical protein
MKVCGKPPLKPGVQTNVTDDSVIDPDLYVKFIGTSGLSIKRHIE